MSDYLEKDYRRVVDTTEDTWFLDGTGIEVIRKTRRQSLPQHALFDFDGTLSLIREGWPAVMVPMMVEFLRETNTAESTEQLSRLAYDFVMELNGKQTIYQMIRLAEEIRQRGGTPREPMEYKQIYHDRLMQRIESRREGLRSGRVRPQDMLVPGTLDLLQRLQDRDVRLYLASGTDENYVRDEVNLLGLGHYFGAQVYGAIDDYRSFSKAKVIEKILADNHIQGDRLIGFGDGYVEIQNVKEVGGLAVAVASDEAQRSGKPDAWKRQRLIGVGADLVIADFQEAARLVDFIWNELNEDA